MASCLGSKPGMLALHLGCVCGPFTLLLGKTRCIVFAADLWIPPTDNYALLQVREIADRAAPISADATKELPFANGSFDPLFTVTLLSILMLWEWIGGQIDSWQNRARIVGQSLPVYDTILKKGGQPVDWREKQRHLIDLPPQGTSWLENINRSVEYIENHLDGVVEVERAAQIAGCSAYHYQRIFSWLAGIPLAEYIRRRRLTLAAFALQRGEKVIDVALRCGYEAPESFSRAFKGLHGILPSAACREGALFQACPPIAFHISVRGDVAMQYRIEQKEAFSLFGRSVPVNTETGEQASAVPAFWQSIREDGTGAEIRQAAEMEEDAPLHAAIYDCTDTGYQYLIGAFVHNGTVPMNFTTLEVPAGAWAVFPMPAAYMTEMMAQAQQLWGRIFSEWFATSGYQLRAAPELELHYVAEDGRYRAEIWIPIEE